jgi:hypothetical protein
VPPAWLPPAFGAHVVRPGEELALDGLALAEDAVRARPLALWVTPCPCHTPPAHSALLPRCRADARPLPGQDDFGPAALAGEAPPDVRVCASGHFTATWQRDLFFETDDEDSGNSSAFFDFL